MSGVQTTTLENGLRIVTDTVADMHTVAAGIWVGVGARHESLEVNGVAHMVEHMLFKGTQKRDALQIAEEIENVGGSMNAYTGREITGYYVHLLADDLPLGLEVLSDMYLNSTLPEDEIERERGVILQEIGMYNDTPDELVFDVYSETTYPDQALGAPILGRAENIQAMTQQNLRDYITNSYQAKNTVISAAGNVQHDEFVARVKNTFELQQNGEPPAASAAKYTGGETRIEKDLEQSHFILGFQGIPRLDDNIYAAQLLSAVLGSGMSSRLFQEVREKRGLVYSIYSYHHAFQDDAQFAIYAGTGPEKMDEIIPVICDELQKVVTDVSEEELNRAKSQMKAGMAMAQESMGNRADYQAKFMILRGESYNVDEIVKRVESVQLDDIKNAAQRIFTTPPTLAALGPLQKLESYESIQKRLAA